MVLVPAWSSAMIARAWSSTLASEEGVVIVKSLFLVCFKEVGARKQCVRDNTSSKHNPLRRVDSGEWQRWGIRSRCFADERANARMRHLAERPEALYGDCCYMRGKRARFAASGAVLEELGARCSRSAAQPATHNPLHRRVKDRERGRKNEGAATLLSQWRFDQPC